MLHCLNPPQQRGDRHRLHAKFGVRALLKHSTLLDPRNSRNGPVEITDKRFRTYQRC